MSSFIKLVLILSLFLLSNLRKIPPRYRVILFGDSITEGGTMVDGTFNDFAIYYKGRADVLNRGFSGYNTNGAKIATQEMIANDYTLNKQPTLVIIMFGSNDCVTEGFSQYVSVENYEKNLSEIINLLKSISSVITPVIVPPPPICDELFRKVWKPVSRSNEGVRKYYGAAKLVSNKENVIFVDTWEKESEEWPQSDCSTHTDGLHLTEKGYKIVTRYIKNAINSKIENFIPDNIDGYPGLDDLDLYKNEENMFLKN